MDNNNPQEQRVTGPNRNGYVKKEGEPAAGGEVVPRLPSGPALLDTPRYPNSHPNRTLKVLIVVAITAFAFIIILLVVLVVKVSGGRSDKARPTTTVTIAAPVSSPSVANRPTLSKSATPTSTNESAFRRVYSHKRFTIPEPNIGFTTADLDIPQGDADSGGDISYIGVHLETDDGKMGKANATEPSSADACVDMAKSRSIAQIETDNFVEGKTAFCVITDRGNVVWLRFIGYSGDGSDLEFELTLWKRSDDQPIS
jgi:hypothetical protein